MFLLPNLPDRGVKTDLSWLSDTVPAAELKKLQEGSSTDRPRRSSLRHTGANLARLNKEGILIALAQTAAAVEPSLEMEDMVAAGMTPMQVIVAGTRKRGSGAEADRSRTVSPGKRRVRRARRQSAGKLTNTRRISAVYLRGSAINRRA